jgi:integrase
MPDFDAYRKWFLVEGSLWERPLGEATLKADLYWLGRADEEGLALDTGDVSSFRSYVVALKTAGLSPGTANNLTTALRRWLRFRDGREYKLPVWKQALPKEKALGAEQKFIVMGYTCESARLQMRRRFMVALALTSGAEPAEVAPLGESDFVVDDRRGRYGVFIRRPCKGHMEGFVNLPKSVLTSTRRASLKTWLAWREVDEEDPEAVFTGRQAFGRPRRMTPAGLSDEMQVIRSATGVPLNWQVTRHTCGTDLLEAGYSERYVQKHLRLHSLHHVSRYAEAREDQMNKAYRSLRGLDPYRGGF